MSVSLIIPNRQSSASSWIEWHKSLLKEGYSRNDANIIFLKAWERRQTEEANTLELRAYLESKGVLVEPSGWDALVDVITTPFGLAKVGLQGMAGVVAVVVILVLILAFRLIWKITTDPNETLETALAIRTGGATRYART